MLSALALAYIRHSPIEIGKWRISRFLEPRLTDRLATVKTADGFLMSLDTHDFIQRTIFLSGRWDEDIAGTIRARLKSESVFVDVGANVGYFSLLAASRCARVISFEPNPICVSTLKSNIELNRFGNVDVRPVGLSDRRGTAVLHMSSDANLGAGSLNDTAGAALPIVLETLDDQLHDTSPSLIKIDVEGAELQVLRGATSILHRDAPDVICEVSEYSLRLLGASKDELFDFMADFGYRCEILSPIRRSNAATASIYFQYDVIFVTK